MVRRVRYCCADGPEADGAGASDQQASRALGEPLGDLGYLFRRLALAQYDLRERVAQGAVVVDLGEADVLVWEQAQLFDGGLDGGRARGDALEQLLKFLLVDDGPPLASE